MKLSSAVSIDKLRGGFYSPDALVAHCWTRINELVGGRTSLRVIEPSAGDGAFIRGLKSHSIADQISRVDAVELLEAEASAARSALADAGLRGEVRTGSFISDITDDMAGYDVAVGNPPFLRYQFVDPADVNQLHRVEALTGTQIGRVSNLWIPVFLSAVARLKDGGAFSFILPAEFLTGVSARTVRDWLTSNTDVLTIDLFPPRSFPGVLQEVIIVSGRMADEANAEHEVTVVDHERAVSHAHSLASNEPTWTALTLEPRVLRAIREAKEADVALALGKVARLGVSTVTGANSYFTFDDRVRRRFELTNWTRPLLARTRHVPGLEATEHDWLSARELGETAWLLDLGADDAEQSAGLQEYIALGETEDLHRRYKTRIRQPWYKVPVVRPKPLLLSKRSHLFPRLIANSAALLTTDTVYQGDMQRGFIGRERQLVAGFHNSLTLLSAEVEGRSFGGGVLELVPSEVARLTVIDPSLLSDNLAELDQLARSDGYESQRLIDATNDWLVRSGTLNRSVIDDMESARLRLLARRLARN
ncbi:Eco57I restriction-modification methylase domain-containing protein [Leifsonia shinshuensis]